MTVESNFINEERKRMSEEKKQEQSVETNQGDKQVQEVKKSNEEVSATTQGDLMDGGFAVVDRERIIAEETRVITPWYKNLVNIFIAPAKAMEETIEADPIKGMGLGFFWSILFAVVYVLITYSNPLQKQQIYDMLRNMGTTEDKLAQAYQMQMISGGIGVVVGVALAALIIAVGLQIIKAICRDKGRFKKLYIMSLFSLIVSYALMCIDGVFQLLVGTTTTVLGIGSLFSAEAIANSVMLQTLAATISVPNIWSIIVLIAGYKVMTRKSTTKAVVVILIYELIGVAFTYGSLMLSQSAMQMMG